MALLSPADQEKLRDSFKEMTANVRLLFFTQTVGCETCLQTRQILDELPPLSGRISVEEVNLVLEKDKAAQYGIDRVPAVALLSQDGEGQGHDSRIHWSMPSCSSAAAPRASRRRIVSGSPLSTSR